MARSLKTGIAVCLMTTLGAIGASHARPISPLELKDGFTSSKLTASGNHVGAGEESFKFAAVDQAAIALPRDYGGIRNELIKYSWFNTRDQRDWGWLTRSSAAPVASSSVPEPGTLALLSFGLLLVAFTRRRRAH